MDTEIKSGKKKYFIIVPVILLVVMGVMFLLTELKNARQAQVQTILPTPPPPRESTEAEKLLKSQSEELDRLRGAHQTATTTIKNQIKSLDAIRTRGLKQKTAGTVIKKTIEQQAQELDALRASVIK